MVSSLERAGLSVFENTKSLIIYHTAPPAVSEILDDHVKYYFQKSCPREQFGVILYSISGPIWDLISLAHGLRIFYF
jgi:hypothetical protein